MASSDRTPNHPLITALLERGHRYAFFEVVRQLQAAHPDAVPVGHQGPPSKEVIRFRPPLDLSFARSDVTEIWADGDQRFFEIASTFLSLYGAASPLPACYTEELLYEDRHGLLREFLDIFNHRLVSLFYRAWEKYRHCVQFDGSGDDPISRRIRILTHLERRGEPIAMLSVAGLLQQQPVSEASMERILSHGLGRPVEVHSCLMRWIEIPSHQRSSLGQASCVLGGHAPIGALIRDVNTAFRVVVRALSRSELLDIFPGGRKFELLAALIARVNTDELDCEVALEIDRDAVQPFRLGSDVGGLGWTTWLGDDEARADTVLKVVLDPNEAKVA